MIYKGRELIQSQYINGHVVNIYCDGSVEYLDGEGFDANMLRPCPKCAMTPDENGHDACLGELGGVKYACCGHGIPGEAYVMYDNDEVIRGTAAEVALEVLRERDVRSGNGAPIDFAR